MLTLKHYHLDQQLVNRFRQLGEGKPFKPGNLCGWGRGRGVTKYKPTVKDSSLDADNTLVKSDDDIIVNEKTTYNEWLAMQGLV